MKQTLYVVIALLVISIGVPKGLVQAVTFPTLYDDFHRAQINPDRWGRIFANGYEKSVFEDVSVGRLKIPLKAYANVGPKKVVKAVPFTLYDDFHGEQIDPGRWDRIFARGYEMNIGPDVVFGRLNIAVQAYGNVGAPGFSQDVFHGVVLLPVVNAAAASAIGIQVTANVEDANVTGCGFSVPSRSRADVVARLFRDGPNPSNPNDFTGVVIAVNSVRAIANLPRPTLQVPFFAERCLDFNCNTTADLGGGTFQNVTLGEDVTLGIELDAANNRIIFTKGAVTQFINNVSKNQFNTDLKGLHLKAIRVVHKLETCPTQAAGSIVAAFENFEIKP